MIENIYPEFIPVTINKDKIDISDGIDSYKMKFARDLSGCDQSVLHFAEVSADAEALFLFARGDHRPFLKENVASGEFIEGLWEYDVAELFIADCSSSEYQEFNLSPSGAWWSCHFESYRKSSGRTIKTDGVETHSEITSDSWQAACRIPYSCIEIDVTTLASVRMNITFITGENEKNYLSWASLKSAQPDFHLPEQFCQVKTIEKQ